MLLGGSYCKFKFDEDGAQAPVWDSVLFIGTDAVAAMVADVPVITVRHEGMFDEFNVKVVNLE